MVDDALRVDDFFYRASPFPVLGENFASITGIVDTDQTDLASRVDEIYDE